MAILNGCRLGDNRLDNLASWVRTITMERCRSPGQILGCTWRCTWRCYCTWLCYSHTARCRALWRSRQRWCWSPSRPTAQPSWLLPRQRTHWSPTPSSTRRSLTRPCPSPRYSQSAWTGCFPGDYRRKQKRCHITIATSYDSFRGRNVDMS